MKLNRKWLLVIALVLSVGMAISGTMAYLTDSSDVAANVMELGSVKIKQHEYERELNSDGSYKTATINGADSYVLKDFSQGKPLYPATEVDAKGQPYNHGAGDYDATMVKMSQKDSHGSAQVFVSKSAQDKFVTVENTGKSDAYVRTLIAYEMGELTETRFDEVIGLSVFMTDKEVWKVTDVGAVAIDGNNYYVVEYLYNGADRAGLGGVHNNGVLPKGDTTYPSLVQVYMAAVATNEDCEKIDGNGNGTYDILVLSQAMQTEGFDNAEKALDVGFGDANATNCAIWFGGTPVDVPFAKVTKLKATDTLTNAAGNVDVVEKDLTIDTTDSKMGLDVGKIPMDVLYQFEPTMTSEEGDKSKYADWHADFVVSVDKDVPAYGIGLAGYYDAWCSLNNDKWVMLASPDAIEAGTEIRLVDAMGGGSITVSYRELCEYGNDGIGFLCGAVDLSDYDDVIHKVIDALEEGTTLTVELRLYEATGGSRNTETGEYVTAGTYTYTFK